MRNPEHESAITAATEAAEWDAAQQGLAVAFERIVVADDAAVASFVVDESRRMIVGLERARGEWDALGSTVLGPNHVSSQSFRPSETRPNHWTIIAGGFAPEQAVGASVSVAGHQHLVQVIGGLYLFAAGVDGEPELERLPIIFVE